VKITTLFAIPLFALATPLHGAAAEHARIIFTVVSCSRDALTAPDVSLSLWPTPAQPSPRPAIATGHPDPYQHGVYYASIDTEPGNYLATAASNNCKTSRPTSVAVFQSQDRHVILLTRRRCCSIPTLYNSSIAVALPDGVTATLHSSGTWNLPRALSGTRDGALVYFSNLAPDKYFLELHVSDVVVCRNLVIPNTRSGYQDFVLVSLAELAPLLQQAAEKPAIGGCFR
jgi:hypothetical protein